jgi:DNA-binding NarL/FixJ family response regulator
MTTANGEKSIIAGVVFANHNKPSKNDESIVRLLVQGKTNQEIADELFMSKTAVAKHLQRLCIREDVKNRVQLAVKYFYLG